MKLLVNAPNCVAVCTASVEVLFSYETAVCVKDLETGAAFVTTTKYSRTTQTHISRYGFIGATPVEQSVLDNLHNV